jgi:hypothetical protein
VFSSTFVFSGSSAADFVLSGGSQITANPLNSIRSGSPGGHSIASFAVPLSPGIVVQHMSFEYSYTIGFGPTGQEGKGSNFTVKAAGGKVYASPLYNDYPYSQSHPNYSQPIAVNVPLSIKVPAADKARIEFDFDNNDRNMQLLLPLKVNVTCTGGPCNAPPAPTPQKNYCPTSEATSNPLNVGDVASCIKPDGTMAPCAPGNQMCPPGPFGKNSPQFHVRDLSCGENDPNGPVYDPVHGVYHLHYQNHVGCRGGRTYGHAVSRDFVHWAHMPISIWNDRPYDEHAIYTGSATVVDGQVVQVYPGLCYAQFSTNCPGGTNLAIAVPADPADPLQTNWTKDTFAVNPIVNNTGRDPSTAWKTPAGEWRLTTFDTMIMGSMDFKTW